jgi:hypothetical protein
LRIAIARNFVRLTGAAAATPVRNVHVYVLARGTPVIDVIAVVSVAV